MINLKKHSTIADSIIINYSGPGFYSGRTSRPLQDDLFLEKVAEEYIDKEDIYHFCKQNGYKVKPYKIKSSSDIPSNWTIDQSVNNIFEEENY